MEQNRNHYIPLETRVEAGYRMAHRHEHHEKVVDIADDLRISRKHLYNLEEKYDEDQSMVDKPRDGRYPKVDDRTERIVLREIRNNPHITSTQISADYNQGMEVEYQISDDTVQNIAHKAGYFSYKPLFKPPLGEDEMTDRLEFAQLYQDRTMHFWRNCIFMDEVYIRLHPKDSRQRVWRQKGQRLEEENILPLVCHGGGGVMFWGCVSWNGTGPLVAVHDHIRGDNYAQLLLNNIPQVMNNLNTQAAYFIEDNPRLHNTPTVQTAKQNLGLRDLNLPTYSPDLNIIENMWSVLKARVHSRAPQRVRDIEEIALEEWANFQLEEIRTYFRSIPDRLRDVITANGGYTRY